MEKNREAYEFLMTGDHEVIIYSALKQLSITKGDPRFEDFVQEAWVKFPTLYAKFPGNPVEDRKQALAYFRNALYRQFLNLLRYQKLRKDRSDGNDPEILLDEQFEEELSQRAHLDNDLYVVKLFKDLYPIVGPGEQCYLMDAFVHELTPTEIAAKREVSRQTVYKWRRNLRTKGEGMRDL